MSAAEDDLDTLRRRRVMIRRDKLTVGGDGVAVQVLIDGQGVEVAAVVPWLAWLALADVARATLPNLFADLWEVDDGIGSGSGIQADCGHGPGDDVGRS